jgi:hypothetical protein
LDESNGNTFDDQLDFQMCVMEMDAIRRKELHQLLTIRLIPAVTKRKRGCPKGHPRAIFLFY